MHIGPVGEKCRNGEVMRCLIISTAMFYAVDIGTSGGPCHLPFTSIHMLHGVNVSSQQEAVVIVCTVEI